MGERWGRWVDGGDGGDGGEDSEDGGGWGGAIEVGTSKRVSWRWRAEAGEKLGKEETNKRKLLVPQLSYNYIHMNMLI
jgi:hypothetical protein